MQYIDYKGLDEFYTTEGLCTLLDMSKNDLHKKCDQYLISPTRNEIGQSVFSKYDVRKLHNKLYYEGPEDHHKWDPWND